MLDRVLKASLAILVVGAVGLVSLHAQAPAKQWKDRGEYDLFDSISKEQDLNKRLALLGSWKQKYPASDYSSERSQFLLDAYARLNQPDKVIETAGEAIQADPKNLQALALAMVNVQRLPKPTPEQLGIGEQAANGLLANADALFAADKKPPAAKDEDWKKARLDLETLAHTTLGWIGLTRKAFDESTEKHFAKSLELTPNNAQVSYWLGTVILGEKKAERQSEALFHFARAASLPADQGGLAAAFLKTVDTYFVNAYNRFHGKDEPGLAELRKVALATPMPPAGFKIEDVNEIAAKGDEAFKKANPELALWRTIKTELTGPNGDSYFSSNMKDAEIPAKFKGKIVSIKPALRPKEVVVSIGDGTTPDATLKFEEALPGKADAGTEVEFTGVAKEFAKEPFMVTFDVEREKLTGWPVKETAPRPAPKKAPAKGAAPAKKKPAA